jgi:hypothetical protein
MLEVDMHAKKLPKREINPPKDIESNGRRRNCFTRM